MNVQRNEEWFIEYSIQQRVGRAKDTSERVVEYKALEEA